MLNQIVIVGRLVKDPEVIETENGTKKSNICLAVPRSYKNAEGLYDTDFINCTLWQGVAENTANYCKKGDVVGIRGRVETSSYEQDGKTKYATNIIAEKVTFLTSKSKEDFEKIHKESVSNKETDKEK